MNMHDQDIGPGPRDISVDHGSTRPGSGGRNARALERGEVIDRFVIVSRIGQGGMGVVYAAYDPELDRKVALKLLLGERPAADATDASARLLREAQALAKLAHPNVVAVHDVGTFGAQVWIAMEFIAGTTLTGWLAAQPRSWREVVAVFRRVGEGLSAAHAAGLVHRDVKPENIMVGDDGRVRVMDFGLARAGLEASRPAMDRVGEPSTAALSIAMTGTSALIGTPKYMAPEQWNSQIADARSDQYSYCVAMWQSLYGEHPFAGDTLVDFIQSVTAGKRRRPGSRVRLPTWLRRTIERGMAVDPAQRWPSMAALLAQLERAAARARLRTAAAVLAGVGLVAAAAEGYRRWDVAERVATCDAASHEIDAAWNDDTRQALRGAFAATGLDYAPTTAEKVLPWFDRQADAWRSARNEACLNASVRDLWDDELVDRALWCLEDRRLGVASFAAEFARADKTVVEKAVSAASALPDVAPCIDPDQLRRQPAPLNDPDEPLDALAAADLNRSLAAIAGRIVASTSAAP